MRNFFVHIHTHIYYIILYKFINNYKHRSLLAGRPLKLVHLQHLTDGSAADGGTKVAAAATFAADPATPAAFMSQQKQQPTHKSSHRVKRSDTSATAENQSDGARPQAASQANEEVVSVQIKGKLITTITRH